ncbi:hypothetical protein [Longimicrobium terrae]|uniref:Uncharacterized protein n=1 Tax=Longimicrobium terrae TaxID=1639882 RepID=A0A841GVI5_9BACT|nr:hypothetical protein [Longimicrobium terrae]MBB4634275.1 hypothetical protein [Longimicrobium terrae]MBB6068835.1 hypothetical protein [Longimicrobium terrae]NNC28017.1 hypothetical protein [Longimicrobium terrae]
MKRWTDPSSGARILLALLPGTSAVALTYTTVETDQWEQRKARGQF